MVHDKNTIRKQILAKRSELSASDVSAAEETAFHKLTALKNYQDSGTVMAYMDFRNEVPTGKIIRKILADGKRLVLPLTDPSFQIIPYIIDPKTEDLSKLFTISAYGISEPNPALCPVADPKLIDLVIIPGSVFDRCGNRLGYGKGCYDRFLPLLREDAYKLALAYSLQVLDRIPIEPTDIKMNEILIV